MMLQIMNKDMQENCRQIPFRHNLCIFFLPRQESHGLLGDSSQLIAKTTTITCVNFLIF